MTDDIKEMRTADLHLNAPKVCLLLGAKEQDVKYNPPSIALEAKLRAVYKSHAAELKKIDDEFKEITEAIEKLPDEQKTLVNEFASGQNIDIKARIAAFNALGEEINEKIIEKSWRIRESGNKHNMLYFKEIVAKHRLPAEFREKFDLDIDSEFWQSQNIIAIEKAVAFFRTGMQV
jgi:seryl-tRNA synthetase